MSISSYTISRGGRRHFGSVAEALAVLSQQATTEPKNQGTKEGTKQAANQATNQPANRPANQPIRQPDNQQTSKPEKHRFLLPGGGLPVIL